MNPPPSSLVTPSPTQLKHTNGAGVDPPDVIKISPCARLECWVDPLSMQVSGAPAPWPPFPAAPPAASAVLQLPAPVGGHWQRAPVAPLMGPLPLGRSELQAPKALDTIGKNLQAQYERWQPRAKVGARVAGRGGGCGGRGGQGALPAWAYAPTLRAHDPL